MTMTPTPEPMRLDNDRIALLIGHQQIEIMGLRQQLDALSEQVRALVIGHQEIDHSPEHEGAPVADTPPRDWKPFGSSPPAAHAGMPTGT